MAASLETTVPGKPDDVVDVDSESLPLPTEQADQVKEALQSSGGSNPQADSGTTTQPSSDGDRQGQSSSSSSADSDRSSTSSSGGSGSSSGPQASEDGSASGLTQKAGLGPGGPVDSLMALLRQLFEQLLAVLAGLLVLGLVALGVHKRALLFDRLRDYLGSESAAVGPREATTKVPSRSPDNEIERTWLEMVSQADVEDDPAVTPRERAEAVAQAGLRREPVRELTSLFEDVRYGDKPVTTSEVREASNYLRQSTGQSDD